MEVCRSAFGALRAVADISTRSASSTTEVVTSTTGGSLSCRSELHQRLVDMGILQHIDADEVSMHIWDHLV